MLYYRTSKLGGGRMPRVGSNQVDERATRMIHDWIARMPGPADRPERPRSCAAEDREAIESLRKPEPDLGRARTKAVGRLAETTRGALLLLGLIDRGGRLADLKREVAAIARTSPHVEVRDLFERFIPVEERVKRLGDVIDRASVLALSGDAVRGGLSSPPTRPPLARPVTRSATWAKRSGQT